MEKIIFRNREEFRKWLEINALSENGIWIIFSKNGAFETMKSSEALEEALCYGWIDGQIKKIDEYSYIKYFKQRSINSNWSEKNKKLAKELEQKNLMTEFGRKKIIEAKKNGKWDVNIDNSITETQLKDFDEMIKEFKLAYMNYIRMSASVRRTYAKSYYLGTKTDEGRIKRINQIIERLELNLNPMESKNNKKRI